jgi:outer membrane beta-barrel protein
MIARPGLLRRAAPGAIAMLLAVLAADAARAQGDAAPDSAVAVPAADTAAAAAPAPELNAPMHSTSRRIRLVGATRNVAHAGPGDAYAVVGVFPAHAEFTVLAKSGDWVGVRLSDTQTGWFHHSLVREFDDNSDLVFRPNPRLYSRTGAFLLEGYSGGYAFDQKSNSLVLGGRLGYYVFDRVTVEGGLSWTHVHRPAEIVESLFGLSLEAEDFHMLFYHFLATYELLPGRQMVPFVSAGVGASVFQGESEPSVNLGAGTTLYLSRRTAVRWEVRDYRFSTGPQDARHTNHNIEMSLGSLVLF